MWTNQWGLDTSEDGGGRVTTDESARMDSPDEGRLFNPRRREDLRWNGKGATDAEGRRVGRWDFPFTDGARCFLTYAADELEGDFAYWHPDGRVEVGTFVNSRRSGSASVYVGERVIQVQEWLDGELNGYLRTIDPDTSEVGIIHFRKGVRDGVARVIREGVAVHSVHYRDGLRDGPYSRRIDTGGIEVVGEFLDDDKHGKWEYFDRQGRLRRREQWEHGELAEQADLSVE